MSSDFLIQKILKCADVVSSELGFFHSEKVYQNSFEIELQDQQIYYEKQPVVPISYKNRYVGFHIPDLVIEKSLIVELKICKHKKLLLQDWVNQISQYVNNSNNMDGLLIIFSQAHEKVFYEKIPRKNSIGLPKSEMKTETVINVFLSNTNKDKDILNPWEDDDKRLLIESREKETLQNKNLNELLHLPLSNSGDRFFIHMENPILEENDLSFENTL
jgi:GxxExxY protein